MLFYHSLVIQLWVTWNRGDDVDLGHRHVITLPHCMLLTAVDLAAGQRANTASLSQTVALLCITRGRCFTLFLVLINFLTHSSLSVPSVTSSAAHLMALLLWIVLMFDITIVPKGGEPEPLVLCGRSLTWPGLGWAVSETRVQPELKVSLYVKPKHWSHSFDTTLALQQARHMVDMLCLRLRLGAGVPPL